MKKYSVLALAVASASLSAQESSKIEHVLVSVPVHKKAAETALPVTVISGEDLKRQASNTIGDTLSNSPGLANASFGPSVGQPVIRGQQGPRVTVLQNGVSSADASNVSADHAVSVEPVLADSVEVLRGPSTLLYGGGAIGGVVNVIDNRIPATLEEGVRGSAELRHDTASSGDTFIGRVDGGSGNFAWHLDGLLRDWDNVEIPGFALSEPDEDGDFGSRGEIENSDGQTSSLSLGGAFHFESGFAGFSVSHLENEYGIPPGGHGHHEEEHDDEDHDDHDEDHDEDHDDHDEDHDDHGEDHDDHDEDHDHDEEEEEEEIRLDIEQTRYDAALHIHEPFGGIDVFRGVLTFTDYEHVELEGTEVGTQFENDTWETRLEFVHSPMNRFHGAFGFQGKIGEFSAFGEEAYIPVTDSTEYGLFLVEDWHSDRWTLEGGLRYDYVERDPDSEMADKVDFNSFSVSGSALFDVTETWQLGFALMHAERAPAIEELFSNADNEGPDEWVPHAATRAVEIGDPDLDTEVSNNIDLRLGWNAENHFMSLTMYFNDFKDYIALFNTGLEVEELPVLAYMNDDAEFYGVEFDSEFTVFSAGEGDLLLGLRADYIRGELDSGDDVPRLPPTRFGASLTWAHPNWNLYASVLDADDQDKPGVNEEPTEGYTRWDAGAEYRMALSGRGEMVLFAKFKNISDEEIRLSTSFLRDVAPEPGRSVEAGLRLNF